MVQTGSIDCFIYISMKMENVGNANMSKSTYSGLSVNNNITIWKKVPLNLFNLRSSPWDIVICFITSLPNQNSCLHASLQDFSLPAAENCTNASFNKITIITLKNVLLLRNNTTAQHDV
jgi:hypothetical protein